MSDAINCNRRDKWFRGCRFESRYDEAMPSGNVDLKGLAPGAQIKIIGDLKNRRYIHDICVTCGLTVQRPEIPDSE